MTIDQLRKVLNEEIKQDRFINAHELKEVHKLKYSTKKIGKELATLAKNDSTIESIKIKGIWQYKRIGTEKVPSRTPETISPPKPLVSEAEISPKTELANVICDLKDLGINTEANIIQKTELTNMIVELKDDGVDVPNVIFVALKEHKDKLIQEKELLKDTAPMIATQYDKMKQEIRWLKNKLQDYADLDQKHQARKMMKQFQEERKVLQGIIV